MNLPLLFRFCLLPHLLTIPLALQMSSRVCEAQEAAPSQQLLANIAYRDGEVLDDYAREQCRLDVLLPMNKTGFATIVWFHGGGLTGGKRSIPKQLQDQNVAVVGVSYRLSPHVKVDDCIRDAAAATAWVIKNIAQYGGDPAKVFVSGHSAGGYLTSMIGYDKRWLEAEGIDADDLAGLIPFSGHTITHFTARKEQGLESTQPLIDPLAPLFHVRADAPPTLLITGDRELEMLGRYEENAYFWRMLKVVKHPDVELYELDGYDHGGMAAPAFPLLLKFVSSASQQRQ